MDSCTSGASGTSMCTSPLRSVPDSASVRVKQPSAVAMLRPATSGGATLPLAEMASAFSAPVAVLPAGGPGDRSAEATESALFRTRSLERSAGRELSEGAINAVLRGVQPLTSVANNVYTGITTWKVRRQSNGHGGVAPIDCQLADLAWLSLTLILTLRC